MRILLIFSVVLVFCIGCKKTNTTTDVSTDATIDTVTEKSMQKTTQPQGIDLDTCDNLEVVFDDYRFSHKNLQNLGDTDTLYFEKGFFSVKTASHQYEEYESEVTLSNIEVIDKSKQLFKVDSILSVGIYKYDTVLDYLLVPIIKNQGMDDLTAEIDLFLLDKGSEAVVEVAKGIINGFTGCFYPEKNVLIYSDKDKLMTYNYESKQVKTLYYFDNPSMSIMGINCIDNEIELTYFKDYTNDIINDIPLKQVRLENKI